MLLRRGMMTDSTRQDSKYPFVNGRHDFSDGGYVEVSEGNHVTVKLNTTTAFVNLSNIFQNSLSSSDVKNINNKPIIYTIPSGVDVRIEIKNVQGQSSFSIATNFRLANSSKSGSFSTGPATHSNPTYNNIIKKNLIESENVGCFFVYCNTQILQPVDFDVELTVDGGRWI